MSSLNFRYPEWATVDPDAWVEKWARAFLSNEAWQTDDRVHAALIEKGGLLAGDDFEQIGRWKEGCFPKKDGKENGKWKPLTTAAYEVWMEAKRNPPQRAADRDIDDAFAERLLNEWSEKTYSVPKKGPTRFGVSRASAILHFLSAGQYPIYDDFIWYALQRLGAPLPGNVTVDTYLKEFCPRFFSLASTCGLSRNVTDLRKLDNALRCYGRDQFPMSAIATSGSLPRK